MMEWRTSRADVTCDTSVAASDKNRYYVKLPGPLIIRILLWLLIFAAFPLSVTAARLSFNLEVQGRSIPAALPPERHVTLAERVLRYLEVAERRESDPWLRDDIRIAWITVLEASRGNHQPHVDATYRVLGIHPDKVWQAILDRCAALLGRSEIPSAAHTIGVQLGHSPDLGTVDGESHRQQNKDAGITVNPSRKRMVTGSAQRAQLRGGRRSDKLGRAEESSGSLDTSPKKPCASERNPPWRKAA